MEICQVSLSTTRAQAGSSITVYVRGFPANSEIDIRLGQQGQAYSVVYDARVGSNGTTIEVVTLPAQANNGEYWVIEVRTTNLSAVVTASSHTIYISEE